MLTIYVKMLMVKWLLPPVSMFVKKKPNSNKYGSLRKQTEHNLMSKRVHDVLCGICGLRFLPTALI